MSESLLMKFHYLFIFGHCCGTSLKMGYLRLPAFGICPWKHLLQSLKSGTGNNLAKQDYEHVLHFKCCAQWYRFLIWFHWDVDQIEILICSPLSITCPMNCTVQWFIVWTSKENWVYKFPKVHGESKIKKKILVAKISHLCRNTYKDGGNTLRYKTGVFVLHFCYSILFSFSFDTLLLHRGHSRHLLWILSDSFPNDPYFLLQRVLERRSELQWRTSSHEETLEL